MDDIKNKSLEEIDELYQKKLKHFDDRRAEYLRQAEECQRQMAVYEQKLRYVRALVNGPEAATAMPSAVAPVAPVKRPARRRRRSPLRDATLKVLRNRPGQKLTARQVRTAIRKDSHKRCSRQTVNNNLGALEEMGLVRRERAPRGSGAQFVFWAV